MSDTKTTSTDPQPGHYGPGYGERDATKTPEPTPGLESAKDAPAGLEPTDAPLDPDTAPRG